jgi:hypothetical protein
LTIDHIAFKEPPHWPQPLPNLTTLDLRYVDIHGPLQEYLDIPNLQELTLTEVGFYRPRSNEGFQEGPLAVRTSDRSFLGGFQILNYVRLQSMSIGDKIVSALQKLPFLHTLYIESCRTENFIHPLLESLENKASFPSLDTLHITWSWELRSAISYLSFAERCAILRPNLALVGNGKYRDKMFYLDDTSA